MSTLWTGTTLSKNLLFIFIIGISFIACRKNAITESESCITQTAVPKQSYSANEISITVYSRNHCGLIPFSSKFYWIYLDSIFSNGNLVATKIDTLRFLKTYRSQPDSLIWWEANKEIGLPTKCYANDSGIFSLEPRLFTSFSILDSRKEIYQFIQDSVKFISSFGDEAAIAKGLHGSCTIPAGSFNDCLFFEKYAMLYRRDQVYLKPGIGVLKYIHQQAPLGSNTIEMQQISTLISYHIQ